MEYKILKKVQKLSIPKYLRIILGIILILSGIVSSLIPVIPGFVLVIAGIILLIPGNKINTIKKIRKGIVYLFSPFSFEKFKHKLFDFKNHIKEIFKSKRKPK